MASGIADGRVCTTTMMAAMMATMMATMMELLTAPLLNQIIKSDQLNFSSKLLVLLIISISLQTTITFTCIQVLRMLSQTTSTPKKDAKRGRKLKSSSLSNFCRICACSFATVFA